MKLTLAFIKNYKSLNDQQKLVVDDKVTAIIGKNESGKSNIIDILGVVDLLKGINETTLKMTNRRSELISGEVELQFEYSEEELKKLHLEPDNNKSNFLFSNEFTPYKVKISGAVSNYFQSPTYQEYLDDLNEIYNKINGKINDASQKQDINTRLGYLLNASSYIIVQYEYHLNIIRQRIQPLIVNDNKENFDCLIKNINDFFLTAYSMFPVFHKFTDPNLKSRYTMNKDFFDKLDNQDDSIRNLIEACGCTINDWKSALLDDRFNPKGMDAKEKINRGILYLEEGFNKFYNQEESVKIKINMDSTVFQLYIDTTGNSIAFTERSNGLQWYLNLYIDLFSKQLTDRRVVFLVDEPGAFLHVDAQKEVLKLFDYLTKDRNQIIYTTHSPFMIEEARAYRIRPIQKTRDGDTIIFNSIQSDGLETKSRVETLSPLLVSLGMKLYQNIGMQEGAIHIVTEGVSDALYLNTMIKYFDYKSIKAIPSKGASNVVDMTFILWGLGYSFKTLFDQDKAGQDGAKRVIDSYTKGLPENEVDEFKKKTIFMVTNAFDEFNSDGLYTIESLVDNSDYGVLNGNYSYEHLYHNKNEKIMLSKYFCDTMENSPDSISTYTKDNFKKLLTKIMDSDL